MEILGIINLPFRNLRIAEEDIELQHFDALEDYNESVMYLAYSEDLGFLFRIGFFNTEGVFTKKSILRRTSDWVYSEYKKNKREQYIEILEHIELYFNEIGEVPDWGTVEYIRATDRGLWGSTLTGPSKWAHIKKGESRLVVSGREAYELILGPIIDKYN